MDIYNLTNIIIGVECCQGLARHVAWKFFLSSEGRQQTRPDHSKSRVYPSLDATCYVIDSWRCPSSAAPYPQRVSNVVGPDPLFLVPPNLS
ncbi:hypothetical protein TorRG33x02_064350 [Trema orientale]|uniref:Uncharacterized protein n=1 Tax=Trema orientale TaxID=63057 RepID=A0A2P5FJ71_TREOI|nr:hypothetical protein TorRG33x02_064350 [Trema orientale]